MGCCGLGVKALLPKLDKSTRADYDSYFLQIADFSHFLISFFSIMGEIRPKEDALMGHMDSGYSHFSTVLSSGK